MESISKTQNLAHNKIFHRVSGDPLAAGDGNISKDSLGNNAASGIVNNARASIPIIDCGGDNEELKKKFKKYLTLVFKDLCVKHSVKGVSAYGLLKVSFRAQECFINNNDHFFSIGISLNLIE